MAKSAARFACLLFLVTAGPAPAPAAEPAVSASKVANHAEQVQCLAFSPDGQYLFSGCEAGVIRMTEVSAGKAVRSFEAPPRKETPDEQMLAFPRGVLALAVGPDGATLYSGGSDRCLHAWDVGSGKGKRLLEDQYVTALALSPDGRTLASTGYGGDLRLLDVKRGTELQKIKGRPERITTAVFSPDGKTLFTGGVTVDKTSGFAVIASDSTGVSLRHGGAGGQTLTGGRPSPGAVAPPVRGRRRAPRPGDPALPPRPCDSGRD
jgi:WD40 repeat protein